MSPARSKRAERVALIRARAGVNPILIAILPIGGLLYAYLASQAELPSLSPVGVVLLTILALLCGAGILLRPTGDRLELFRLFSFWYLAAFCIGPLFEPAVSLYVYDDPKPALVERAAGLALLAYVSIAIGYHLPLYRRAPPLVMARHDEYHSGLATIFGLALFGIGVLSFLTLFVLAGGAAVVLRGEGGVHRTEFAFGGLGPLFYASLWMVPGGALYFAARASQQRLLAWIHGWPLVSTFALLMLLQGRHRAMGPILVMFAISHYLIRRIRLPRLAVYGLVGVALAIIISSARSPLMRGTFVADPVGYSRAVLRDFPERMADLMSGDIGRLDEVMLVIDHVPDRMPYDYGWSLTIPLNPIRRLIWGVGREAPMVGERIYVIARPDMRNAVYRTGFLPSLVGEMRANFPTAVCTLFYLAFGMLLRFVYQRLIVRGANFLSVAAYAITALFLCNTVIGTIGQSMFELLVDVLPLLVLAALVRRRGRKLASAPAPLQPAATPPA